MSYSTKHIRRNDLHLRVRLPNKRRSIRAFHISSETYCRRCGRHYCLWNNRQFAIRVVVYTKRRHMHIYDLRTLHTHIVSKLSGNGNSFVVVLFFFLRLSVCTELLLLRSNPLAWWMNEWIDRSMIVPLTYNCGKHTQCNVTCAVVCCYSF